MNFDSFTFRCSSLGYIMSEPKEKSNLQKYKEANVLLFECEEKYAGMKPELKTAIKLAEKIKGLKEKISFLDAVKNKPNLSQTCKSHLADIYTEEVFGRKEDIQTKFFEKGLMLEEDAITAYSMLTQEFHKKNKTRLFNDYINGETDFDVNPEDKWVLDTKVNWSIFQYMRLISKPIDIKYEWQLQGYMWLWDKGEARLVYALLNTPEKLIKNEEQKLLYSFVGSEEDYELACQELRKNHIYDDIPLEKKVRIFTVKRDESKIERIKPRVIECRNFLNNIENFAAIDNEAEAEEDSVAA